MSKTYHFVFIALFLIIIIGVLHLNRFAYKPTLDYIDNDQAVQPIVQHSSIYPTKYEAVQGVSSAVTPPQLFSSTTFPTISLNYCTRRYSEPLITFIFPCDWEVIHSSDDYNHDSELHVMREDQQIGLIDVYPKGTVLGTDDLDKFSLLDFMKLQLYMKNGLLSKSCSEKIYGTLSGYECTVSSYGFKSFNFISKKNGAFIVISKVNSQYTQQFRALTSSFQLMK